VNQPLDTSANRTVRLHPGNAWRFFSQGLPFALVLALVLGAATYPLAQRAVRSYTATATLVLYANSGGDRSGVLTPSSLPPDGYRTALIESDLRRRTAADRAARPHRSHKCYLDGRGGSLSGKG